MNKLARLHPEKLLDLLTERLTFERTVVKLYDSVIPRMKTSGDKTMIAMIGQMTKQRNEEKDHEEWLEEQVRALGSDAHTETELSELIERESRGILEIIAQDDELPHLFHALLTAELVDDNGWKLLLELADEADDALARREFKQRAEEEEKHLIYVRSVVVAFARKDVLGSAVQIPAAP
jgi:bacterioferritin (cytochrome b1)